MYEKLREHLYSGSVLRLARSNAVSLVNRYNGDVFPDDIRRKSSFNFMTCLAVLKAMITAVLINLKQFDSL